jgi:dTDP-4-amino-4,6-dideoxygalactose transaminase
MSNERDALFETKKISVDLNPSGSVSGEVEESVKRVLEKGKLYRYDCSDAWDSEVSLMEREFAEYIGAKYAVAVNSCSSAIYLALLCSGVKPGDKVLVPAFTFTAVPSAVVHAGAVPVLVEVSEDYCIDTDSLKKAITEETRVLLLSHMRGHVADMDGIVEICRENGLTLIEDSAHSLGMTWKGRHSGTIGHIGCYSTQSYKLIDAGEGGIFATDDEHAAAKAIIYAGSYEKRWQTHLVRPDVVSEYQDRLPSFNFRMNNLTAAVIRAQRPLLPERVRSLTEKYETLAEIIGGSAHIHVPERDQRLTIAPDSIQFTLKGLEENEMEEFVALCNGAGISVGIFGRAKDNARCYWNWKYLSDVGEYPRTRALLASTCDMRLPHRLTIEEVEEIGSAIVEIMDSVVGEMTG